MYTKIKVLWYTIIRYYISLKNLTVNGDFYL
jgi:hypothetical protein